MKNVIIGLVVLIAGCSTNHIYIVRHAEKMAMSGDSTSKVSTDPPLSEAGKVRSFVLRDELKDKPIRYVFSTNTRRTISTAIPTIESRSGLHIEMYSSSPDSLNEFIARLKAIKKGDVLVVGHSNTIDDIVNRLCGATYVNGDLKDTDYDNLFIVTRKGSKMIFTRKKYGYPSSPE